ncbi:MAG: PLD nuclease N-terminal domain-containing protein [Pseudomonadota bacterium]
MFGLEVGLLGLIGLVLIVYALFHVIGSQASPLAKALWTVLIIVVPFLGFILWLIFGPRAPRR